AVRAPSVSRSRRARSAATGACPSSTASANADALGARPQAASAGATRAVILLGRTLLLLLLCGPLAGCAWLGLGGDARAKARGPEILVQAGGRSHYFENRSPHCLAYTLPGEWEFATAEATLRAAGGRYVAV